MAPIARQLGPEALSVQRACGCTHTFTDAGVVGGELCLVCRELWGLRGGMGLSPNEVPGLARTGAHGATLGRQMADSGDASNLPPEVGATPLGAGLS